MLKYKIIIVAIILMIVVGIVAFLDNGEFVVPEDVLYECNLSGASENWEVDSLNVYIDKENKLFGEGSLKYLLDEDLLRGLTDFDFKLFAFDGQKETLIYHTWASSYAPMYYIEKETPLSFEKESINYIDSKELSFRIQIKLKRQNEALEEVVIPLEAK